MTDILPFSADTPPSKTNQNRRHAIIPPVTLREAGRRLESSPDRVRGWAEAIGVEMIPVGNAICMTESDFKEVAKVAYRVKGRILASVSSN